MRKNIKFIFCNKYLISFLMARKVSYFKNIIDNFNHRIFNTKEKKFVSFSIKFYFII